MINKKGSSLLSFLVYLILFSMIALFLCHVVSKVIMPARALTHTYQILIALHVATDLFVKDLRAIKNTSYIWKVITPHMLIWHDTKKDIGWQFSDHQLERIEGIYKKGTWTKRKRSVAAMGIKEATFSVEKIDDTMVGVQLTLIPLIDTTQKIQGYVAL